MTLPRRAVCFCSALNQFTLVGVVVLCATAASPANCPGVVMVSACDGVGAGKPPSASASLIVRLVSK